MSTKNDYNYATEKIFKYFIGNSNKTVLDLQRMPTKNLKISDCLFHVFTKKIKNTAILSFLKLYLVGI